MNIIEQKPSEIFTRSGAYTETWFVLYVVSTKLANDRRAVCRCRDIKPVFISMNGFERKTHSNKLDKRSPTNIFNCIVQYMRILGLVSASRPFCGKP